MTDNSQEEPQPWQCDGCRQLFGSARTWFRTHGWLPDRLLANGKRVPQLARLCNYCYDNHKNWRTAS